MERGPPVHDTPNCQQCNRPMQLAADISRLGDRAGARLFSCDGCGTVTDIPTRKEPPHT
jgi:hypothetical protein